MFDYADITVFMRRSTIIAFSGRVFENIDITSKYLGNIEFGNFSPRDTATATLCNI